MKRTILHAGLLVVALGCLCAMTCELPVADPGSLEASWTLETTPSGGRDLGSGSFSIEYTETTITNGVTYYSYSGTGTLFNGTPFYVSAVQAVVDGDDDGVLIGLTEQAFADNTLTLLATLDSAGDYIYDGTYSGWYAYQDDWGTFTATKN